MLLCAVQRTHIEEVDSSSGGMTDQLAAIPGGGEEGREGVSEGTCNHWTDKRAFLRYARVWICRVMFAAHDPAIRNIITLVRVCQRARVLKFQVCACKAKVKGVQLKALRRLKRRRCHFRGRQNTGNNVLCSLQVDTRGVALSLEVRTLRHRAPSG